MTCAQLLQGVGQLPKLPNPESLEFLSDEVQIPGAGQRLGTAARPQLAVETVDVGLDGAHRDAELTGDLLVGIAGGDEREHLELPLAWGLGEPLVGNRRRRVFLRERPYEPCEV